MVRSGNSKNIIKDVLWYSLGTIIPILVSLLRTPIFTRYFTAQEYGTYGLVFISLSIFSVFVYTWLANSIWRFYFKFKKLNKLDVFYTNLIAIFLISSVLFSILVGIWIIISQNTPVNQLVILIFFQTFTSQLVSFLLILFRLENKSGLYTTVHSFRAIISFSIQCLITFVMGMRIEAIPIATIIAEFLIMAFLIKPIRKLVHIKPALISRRIICYIFSYFVPGIVSNISTLLLTLSDRYIIKLFGTDSEVGIYNQIYNFGQISIVALISIFFAVINPEFLNILEQKPEKTKDILIKYHLIYLLFILPFVAFMSIYAEPITSILFGKEFRVGYTMIPFIVFSYYLNGLISFRDTKFKFENRYRIVIIGFTLATILNIALNFILIPIYGYQMAALTTLLAYLFLFFYYQFYDKVLLLHNKKFRNTLIIVTAILLLLTGIHFSIHQLFSFKSGLIYFLVEGTAFVVLYAGVLYIFFRKTVTELIKKED